MNPPTGTVTYLLTDIEGSTRLWEQAPEQMRHAHARHLEIIADSIRRHSGTLVLERGEGDSTFAWFPLAPDALAAVTDLQLALHAEDWPTPAPLRVRAALHTGAPDLGGEGYNATTVNRCARIRSIAHGGQTLLSQATVELAQDSLPEGVSLRNLGRHRLRDLSRPEQVFQLCHPDLPDDFSPLLSLDALPTNLPAQLTSFIGREKEMEEVQRLLASTRLLTLTGTGGCGKTRLALQAGAALINAYEDGAWFVDLAPLADPALAAQAVAEALGVREEPGRSLAQTLAEHLKPRELLLVLDNCEHLIEECARLADTLLRAGPRLKILATSREPLGVAGERTYRVPSLLPPEPDRLHEEKDPAAALLAFDAARLFVERARERRSDFAVTRQNAGAVAQVCRRLDGIPLALELAAARIRVLTVEQIAARLDDLFHLLTGGSRAVLPRQQTLRALIDWSYDLLSEAERLMLCRLSVFAGGWTLEAAEAVCSGEGIEDWQVLDLLTGLVDKSLVLFDEPEEGEGRYRLLETVRQYGLERLTEAGSLPDARDGHMRHYLALAETAEPHLKGAEQAAWLQRLETEHDNLRAALTWALSAPGVSASNPALRFCGALRWFWEVRGHFGEGRSWCAAALSRGEASDRTEARAKTLGGEALLAYRQGDYPRARARFEESLAIYQHLGDPWGIAASYNDLGNVAFDQGDYADARALYEQSLDVKRQTGNRQGIANTLLNLGNVARCQNDGAAAITLLEESLATYRELGNRQGVANALLNLGSAAFERGEHAGARDRYEECLRLCRDLGMKWLLCYALEAHARYADAHARPAQAAREFGAAAALRERIATPLPPTEREDYDQALAEVREALGEETFAAAWEQGRAMSPEQAVACALEAPGA